MKRTVRTIGVTASTLLLAASWSFAHATPGAGVEPHGDPFSLSYRWTRSASCSRPAILA